MARGNGRPDGIKWMELAGDELSSIDCATIVRAKERWRVDGAALRASGRASEDVAATARIYRAVDFVRAWSGSGGGRQAQLKSRCR